MTAVVDDGTLETLAYVDDAVPFADEYDGVPLIAGCDDVTEAVEY